MSIDIPATLQAIAVVIGALTAFVVAVGGFILQILNFFASRKRDRNIADVHSLVNSQSEVLRVAVQKASFADGKDAGVLQERADPHLSPTAAAQVVPPVDVPKPAKKKADKSDEVV